MRGQFSLDVLSSVFGVEITEYNILTRDINDNPLEVEVVYGKGSIKMNVYQFIEMATEWMIKIGIFPEIGYAEFGYYMNLQIHTHNFNTQTKSFSGLDNKKFRPYDMGDVIQVSMKWIIDNRNDDGKNCSNCNSWFVHNDEQLHGKCIHRDNGMRLAMNYHTCEKWNEK